MISSKTSSDSHGFRNFFFPTWVPLLQFILDILFSKDLEVSVLRGVVNSSIKLLVLVVLCVLVDGHR